MNLSGFVSTPEIEGVEDIDLEDTGTYRIMAWGPGQLTWRRREVRSPYVHGSTLVGAVKENLSITLQILVEGDDAEDLVSKMSLLLRAFEQPRYRVGITVDGASYEWYCQPADYQTNTDGSFRADHWRQHVQVVTFRIPRDPTPIEGSH